MNTYTLHYILMYLKREEKNMLEKCPQIAQCTNLEKNCTTYECRKLFSYFEIDQKYPKCFDLPIFLHRNPQINYI